MLPIWTPVKLSYLGRVVVTGKIVLQSGMHIGSGKDSIEIGGIDNPVVKHPHPRLTNAPSLPYIPGSSLKGKLRSLLEWEFGKVSEKGVWQGNRTKFAMPHRRPDGSATVDSKVVDDPLLRVFGTTAQGWNYGPTRLRVADSFIEEAAAETALREGRPLTEEKNENNIERISGRAGQGVRRMERVVAGVPFMLDLTYLIFDAGDGGKGDLDGLDMLRRGLALLEIDALGGSGSRGYGKVKVGDFAFAWRWTEAGQKVIEAGPWRFPATAEDVNDAWFDRKPA